MDYSLNASNIFIPMSTITHRNATQFVRGRPKTPMPVSQYYPEPHQLLELEAKDSLEVGRDRSAYGAHAPLTLPPTHPVFS